MSQYKCDITNVTNILIRFEVANWAETNREDLLQDLSSLVYSLCARLYGPRRAKRKQELIGKILTTENAGEGTES